MPTETRDPQFAALTAPYRRELFTHCYRMLGSLSDADDLVQETYLRAWRGFGAFEGRSSLRTWLYRIATHACLDALDSGARRVLPSGLGTADDDALARLAPALGDPLWLQPLPTGADPAESAVGRSRTRLAMIAALQALSARERAAVILRDVLEWRAADVAVALDTSTAAVNSALQRARARLAELKAVEDDILEPADPRSRAALDRYVDAFHTADIDGLVDLLRYDVVLEMPPIPTWFAGRDRVGTFLASRVLRAGQWSMRPTEANDQPAAAAWLIEPDGVRRPHGVHVLTLTGTGIARITVFRSPGLLARFGFVSD